MGSEVNEDGTILMGKSNDYQDVWANYVTITERIENKPGRTMPADMSCVTWECTGPALYGVFVPVSNAALSISKPYSRCQSAEDAGVFDTEHYPYYRIKELNTLGVEKADYQIYGAPVQAYWHKARP